MKSYEKLKAKNEIYEEMTENIQSLIDDLKNHPEQFLEDETEVNKLSLRAIKDCANLINHELYKAKEQIWKLK